MATSKLIGEKELKEKLEKLGSRARASLLTATQAGGEVIREEANRNAPGPHVVMGHEKAQNSQAEVEIGPDEEHWYYRFFEFGAGPHEIKAKTAAALAFEGRSGLVITQAVQHPGMAAVPFLRPAMDGKRKETVAEMGQVFRREIDRLVED
jgi:HK97 gp10 family phage protein